jgi:hypothetical protein
MTNEVAVVVPAKTVPIVAEPVVVTVKVSPDPSGAARATLMI